jgi:hypothetical protein
LGALRHFADCDKREQSAQQEFRRRKTSGLRFPFQTAEKTERVLAPLTGGGADQLHAARSVHREQSALARSISRRPSRFNAVGRLPDGTQFMAFVTGAFPTGMKFLSACPPLGSFYNAPAMAWPVSEATMVVR